MKFNKRIGRIPTLGERKEINLEGQKMALNERLEKFRKDIVFQSNLTEEEEKGKDRGWCEGTWLGPWSH